MKNPGTAYWYAREVIKGRWPEAEPLIMKDPGTAYNYANRVIRARWPEAEPYIMKNPEWACYYARDVIQGRWPAAEPYIRQDPRLAREYKRHFKIQDDLKENDDDLFADSDRLTNPVMMARVLIQVAEEFEYRADRVSSWAAAKSYRDDAAIMRFAARSCKSGLRACMKELTAIDDPSSWEYLVEVLHQDFDIDLGDLYDQYERGELTESVEESDDDLFSDVGYSNIQLPTLTTPSLENLFYAFSFETRPEQLMKTHWMMMKIAHEFKRRGQPLSDAVLKQYDLQAEQ